MKYYAYVESEIAGKLGLCDRSKDPYDIGGKLYAPKEFEVDRDVYEKAGLDHGKLLKISGKMIQDKYVFAF